MKRLAAVTVWILAGAALTGGVYWAFLNTPESTVGALLLSALLAVFAIMPSVTPTKNGGNNILFFGVFSRMTEAEYTQEVMDNLHDDEHIYQTMLRDVYQNGLVLQNKKYKFLGYAYRAFLAGLILTLISLVLDQFGLL